MSTVNKKNQKNFKFYKYPFEKKYNYGRTRGKFGEWAFYCGHLTPESAHSCASKTQSRTQQYGQVQINIHNIYRPLYRRVAGTRIHDLVYTYESCGGETTSPK